MAKSSPPKTPTFPYMLTHQGRTGTIYDLKSGKFKTYFVFAGEPKQNTFASFEAAYKYLIEEFGKLDTDRANAVSLTPLNNSVRTYAELEHLLRQEGAGATIQEAVAFYLAHNKTKRFAPKTVEECAKLFIQSQRTKNTSPSQIKTLEKHFRRFKREFGNRKIHEITKLEIENWLGACKDEKTGKLWSDKTYLSNRGSLVSLSRYAQEDLDAIPKLFKTEFQRVSRRMLDGKEAVEIYTPTEMEKLLLAAFEYDLDLLPVLVIGGFQGLRPAEIHGEGVKRPRLKWEAFIWADRKLHVTGQKVRSIPHRDFDIHDVTSAWLEPFRNLEGVIWKHKQAHSKKLIALREKAGVKSIYDGFRHSYASYRIRQLKNNLPELALEMGNSPREIVNSYKRNVTDAQAEEWFSIMPPPDYAEKVSAALRLRQATVPTFFPLLSR